MREQREQRNNRIGALDIYDRMLQFDVSNSATRLFIRFVFSTFRSFLYFSARSRTKETPKCRQTENINWLGPTHRRLAWRGCWLHMRAVRTDCFFFLFWFFRFSHFWNSWKCMNSPKELLVFVGVFSLRLNSVNAIQLKRSNSHEMTRTTNHLKRTHQFLCNKLTNLLWEHI